MERSIEEIEEDIFFRPDSFQNEPWYNDLQMYMTGGVCQLPEEHALWVYKVLKVVSCDTHIIGRDGRTYILLSEARQAAWGLRSEKHDDQGR